MSTTIKQLYQLFESCTQISTDSRTVEKDTLFFALSGERFDGNRFAKNALEKGAKYAVIDNVEYQEDDRYILVKDALKSLQDLAYYHRQQFKIPIIGITGSNGKTTTKELMASVLSSHYRTHFTSGNFNNHIGVPLTLLAMPKETEVAIIEMGMNHLGEIAALCEIADPTHGLITNIGKAHLEGVGGIEGVKKAKSELYDYLKAKNHLLFVNRDEPFLWELAGESYRKKLAYSSHPEKAAHSIYQAIPESLEPTVKVRFRDDLGNNVPVQTQLMGAYNFQNVMTAITIGQYFKVPPLKIKAAIEQYVPTNNRSQWIEKGSNIFLLDAYNANPSSMSNVLDYFEQYKAERKVVILGDMLELGKESLSEHQYIVQQAKKKGFDQIILVGQHFGACRSDQLHFDTVEALIEWFSGQTFKETAFLVKGSRGIQLEQLLETID
ncbi:MAG: UDP-N-acetylmuramoyl-tripeptide--D-alanyl-D-alanine ligase [Bacteroidota bacterium]